MFNYGKDLVIMNITDGRKDDVTRVMSCLKAMYLAYVWILSFLRFPMTY
jgi:hypothetical protein